MVSLTIGRSKDEMLEDRSPSEFESNIKSEHTDMTHSFIFSATYTCVYLSNLTLITLKVRVLQNLFYGEQTFLTLMFSCVWFRVGSSPETFPGEDQRIQQPAQVDTQKKFPIILFYYIKRH